MASRAGKTGHVAMAMHEVTVAAARTLSPHLRRVTLTGESLRAFRDDGPDQRCKLLLPRPGQAAPVVPAHGDAEFGWYQNWLRMPVDERPVLRTYTVRAARPDAAELDVDMLVHGSDDTPAGPGGTWAARAQVGDAVALFGAYAEYELPGAPADTRQLIAGDHCALPAVAAILERLTPEATGRALLEVPPGDRLELVTPPDLGLTWLDADPDAPGARLAAAVGALPADERYDYAWVVGDQRTAAAMRRHLVRGRGMAPDRVMFMGYWRTDGAIDDLP